MGILPPFHFSISNPVRTVLMLWNNLMLTSECSCGLLDSVKSKLSSYKLPRLSISLRMTDRKSFKKTKSARNWVGYFIWQMSWKYPAYHSHLNDIIEKRQAATFNVSNWAIKIWSLQGENIFIELWRRRRRRSGGVGWRQLFHCHGNIWHLNLHDVHIINHVALSLETFQIWNPTRRWAFTPDICIMKTSVRYKLKHLRYQHEAKKTKQNICLTDSSNTVHAIWHLFYCYLCIWKCARQYSYIIRQVIRASWGIWLGLLWDGGQAVCGQHQAASLPTDSFCCQMGTASKRSVE